MALKTAIAWATSTFNAWWGCTKVSEACKWCYADAWARRTGRQLWGPMAPRRFFGEKHWAEPLRWERQAAALGKPWRVFCSSMADVFEALPPGHPDSERMAQERSRLWRLIDATPHLTWLLLTKRPENIQHCAPWAKASDGTPLRPPPKNVWLGTTVEDQASADARVPWLLEVPAVVRFLSCEPLLERVDFAFGEYNRPGLFWKKCPTCDGSASVPCEGGGAACPTCFPPDRGVGAQGWVNAGIDWLICGGESHPSPAKARPFNIKWALDLKEQCREAGVAFFMKQLGDRPVTEMPERRDDGLWGRVVVPFKKTAKAGTELAEFPEALRTQEFPKARAA